MRQLKFTASYNCDLNEWSVFCNGDIFCHLVGTDFDIFIEAFQYEIETI